jgi:hypothetical protein|tara:strand:- start:1671 stop:1946 length:276 start_codon:yes stop_codon:yes gene_type:complete
VKDHYDLSIGDLVRYVKHPKTIIPSIITGSNLPLGIVLDIKTVIVGVHPDAGLMTVVTVKWSIAKWNGKSGISEENPCDLEVLQKLKKELI